MENYIIRIYRYEKDRPRKIVGTVEVVGVQEKKAFTCYDELWDILNPAAGRDVPPGGGKGKPERPGKA